jgi:hypothetical protein
MRCWKGDSAPAVGSNMTIPLTVQRDPDQGATIDDPIRLGSRSRWPCPVLSKSTSKYGSGSALAFAHPPRAKIQVSLAELPVAARSAGMPSVPATPSPSSSTPPQESPGPTFYTICLSFAQTRGARFRYRTMDRTAA